MATPQRKIANFKSEYLENCHKYENNCQLQKFLIILSNLQKCLLEISATKNKSLKMEVLTKLYHSNFFWIFTSS